MGGDRRGPLGARTGDELVDAPARRVGGSSEKVRIAVRSYAEYPDEIDLFTSNRQFPRGEPGTTGRFVKARRLLVSDAQVSQRSLFLERLPSH